MVEVTPRKLRDGGQAQDQAAAARLREATPDRALKKVCGEIKRHHRKMWRGEEEPVVARAAGRAGTGACEESLAALAAATPPKMSCKRSVHSAPGPKRRVRQKKSSETA